MNLQGKIKTVWKKELKLSGANEIAKEAGVDPRTIVRAIETGNCHKETYDAVNRALLIMKQRRESDPIINQLIAG